MVPFPCRKWRLWTRSRAVVLTFVTVLTTHRALYYTLTGIHVIQSEQFDNVESTHINFSHLSNFFANGESGVDVAPTRHAAVSVVVAEGAVFFVVA